MTTTNNNNQDFQDGRAAFFQGATPDQCPHPQDSQAWQDWQDGFDDAEQEGR